MFLNDFICRVLLLSPFFVSSDSVFRNTLSNIDYTAAKTICRKRHAWRHVITAEVSEKFFFFFYQQMLAVNFVRMIDWEDVMPQCSDDNSRPIRIGREPKWLDNYIQWVVGPLSLLFLGLQLTLHSRSFLLGAGSGHL